MVSFLIRILGNGLALYVATMVVPGFVMTGNIEQYAIAAVVLALLNATIRPILKTISFPLIILSLGLFTIVINALILWGVDYLFPYITIENLTALVWATIVISLINFGVSIVAKIA